MNYNKKTVTSIILSLTIIFFSFSQDSLKYFDYQSYFMSYDIKKSEILSEGGEVFSGTLSKTWTKKEIGYLSRMICDDCDSVSEGNWVNKFNSSDKSQFTRFSIREGLPHGQWDFGNYKGEFNYGKQHGEWILNKVETNPSFKNGSYQGEQKDVLEIHEFYNQGVAEGQWYTIKNGVRYNTFNFKEGKLDREITLNIGLNNCSDKANFKDGLPHGSFIHYFDKMMYDKSMYVKGSYNMGSPNGIWEWSNNKVLVKIEFIDSLGIVRYTDFDRNNTKQIIEYDISGDFTVTQSKWFGDRNIVLSGKNKKYIDFYENGKIKRIWHSGTDEYREGKKDQEFYPNGNIKIEGVLDEYRKQYDINGKLIKTSGTYKSL